MIKTSKQSIKYMQTSCKHEHLSAQTSSDIISKFSGYSPNLNASSAPPSPKSSSSACKSTDKACAVKKRIIPVMLVYAFRLHHFILAYHHRPQNFPLKKFSFPSFFAVILNTTQPSGHTTVFVYLPSPPMFSRSPPLLTASIIGNMTIIVFEQMPCPSELTGQP